MKKETKVFIVDDHPVFLSGLRMLIEAEQSLKIAGDAGCGEEALEKIGESAPDVIVLDLSLPGINGVEVVRALQKEKNEAKIIILTMHDEEATVNSALNLGIQGYILKDSALSEIVKAIKLVTSGKSYVSPQLSNFLLNRNQNAKQTDLETTKLTPAEAAILRLIAQEKTTKEIAKELFVSHRTIDRHRYNICNKLGIKGINSLLKFAIQNKSELP
jgi:two-component system, NarL family, response regulator DegU